MAEERGRKVTGTTRRHAQTVEQVKRQYATAGNAIGLVQIWTENYRPSTAYHYACILRRMHPEIRASIEPQVTALRQEAGVLNVRRALAAPPEVIRQGMQKKDLVAAIIYLMWISASRHRDLEIVREWSWENAQVLRLRWDRMKSDRFGQRAPVKYIHIHKEWKKLLSTKAVVNYRTISSRLKKIDPTLTVHSVRRGACTQLAQMGMSMEDIALLSAHSQGMLNQMGVRRYVDPSMSQPEGKKQVQMSQLLSSLVM